MSNQNNPTDTLNFADKEVLAKAVPSRGNNGVTTPVDESPYNQMSVFDWGAVVTGCAREPNSTWTFAEKQVGMIQDELDEVKRAVHAKNIEEFYDGIMDVIFLSASFAFLHQHDYNTGYETMCHALFSRFDDNVKDAELTKEKYSKLGVQTYNIERVTPLGTRWVTYVAESTRIGDDNYPKDKWLKSHKFHQPDYTNQLPIIL